MTPSRRDLLGYCVGLAAGAVGLFAFGFVELWLERYIGSNDFSGIWAGPRALVLGLDPYDARTWPATVMTLQGQVPQTAVYGYPGYVLVALIPLALMPLPAAAIVWAIGGVAAAAIAFGALLRRFVPGLPGVHGLFGVTLLLSQPAFTSFYDGQWSFILVAACAGAVLLIGQGAPLMGGVVAAVLLAKPHLFLLALPAFGAAALAKREARAIAAALAIGAGLVITSIALLPHWPAAFIAHSGAPRIGSPRVTTLPVAAGDLAGAVGTVLALAAIALAIFCATRLRPRQDAFLAAWLAAGFLAAPYAWSYDQLVLLVPLCMASGVAARRSRTIGVLVATAGCAVLLVGGLLLHGLVAAARASESMNAFVAAAAVAIVLAAVWPRAPRPEATAT